MTITSTIDVGQILIALLLSGVGILISVIGWFIKLELNRISNTLSRHDSLLYELNGIVQGLLGLNRLTGD